VLPEVCLQLADAGLIGSANWRHRAYQYGGFWSGLLRNWRANYAFQPEAMFLSYAWLHAGFGHLLGNMATLIWVGRALLGTLSPRRFIALYLASAVGGALAFGMMTEGRAPMVGASGALFGLAGAWVALDWRACARPRARGGLGRRRGTLRTAGFVAGLVALNLAVWWVQGGILAWQAHLGGGLTGAALVLAMGVPRRPPAPLVDPSDGPNGFDDAGDPGNGADGARPRSGTGGDTDARIDPSTKAGGRPPA